MMTRLTVPEVNDVWTDMLSRRLSPNATRIARTVLRAAFTQAEREGIIARNVVALSNPPKLNPSDGLSLTVDQAKGLLRTEVAAFATDPVPDTRAGGAAREAPG
ncbi:hypothetical protein [Streptodolium elevatio]